MDSWLNASDEVLMQCCHTQPSKMHEQSIFQFVAPTDLPDWLIFRIRVKPPCEKYFAEVAPGDNPE